MTHLYAHFIVFASFPLAFSGQRPRGTIDTIDTINTIETINTTCTISTIKSDKHLDTK